MGKFVKCINSNLIPYALDIKTVNIQSYEYNVHTPSCLPIWLHVEFPIRKSDSDIIYTISIYNKSTKHSFLLCLFAKYGFRFDIVPWKFNHSSRRNKWLYTIRIFIEFIDAFLTTICSLEVIVCPLYCCNSAWQIGFSSREWFSDFLQKCLYTLMKLRFRFDLINCRNRCIFPCLWQ